MRFMIAWLALVIVLFAAIILWWNSWRTPAPYRGPTTAELVPFAQAAVKDALKAPSTAVFASISEEADQYALDRSHDGYYVIRSWVDSQNAFGAMLRDRWVVALVPTIKDRRVDSCEVTYVRIGNTVVVDGREGLGSVFPLEP